MRFSLLLIVCVVCIGVHCEDEMEREEMSAKIKTALEKGREKVNEVEKKDRVRQKEGVDDMDEESANGQLGMFAAPVEQTKKLAKEASIQLAALKELFEIEDIDTHRLRVNKHYLKIWKRKFKNYCPASYSGTCDSAAYYRSADGTCNNLKNPSWGAQLSPQLREIPPMYNDGIDSPRQLDRLGEPLPSARSISNMVHSVQGRSPRNDRLTMMVMQWGQFIDHEFVATPTLKGLNGANIQCCGEENEDRPQCFPIKIPEDDAYFNITCMNFVRSAPVVNSRCNPGHREQMNQVTSYIDGSAIYGSNLNETNALRKMKGGLLRRLSTTPAQNKDMLPRGPDNKCRHVTMEDYCQQAGDARVNVVPSLGWSHTTFFREHNRIASILGELNLHWDDETIFQQTRRIISAIEQIINYKEYLPAILNKDSMTEYRLALKDEGYRKTYNPKTNPTIANVFSTAAFRFGHSQIANYQAVMSKQYKFTEKLDIEETYHRPHMAIYENGMALDGIARWLIADPVPLADGLFEDGVRNKLFLDKDGNSLDLPTLNIQRGRDHGIPGYNHWRVHCGLDKADMNHDDNSFILPDHDEDAVKNLQSVYRHVDDIDLFAGAMTETLLPDSSVGPTFACLIGRQFRRLFKGDRYWHETPDKSIRFTPDQLSELRKVTLARVLCYNYRIDQIQPNVFHTPGPGNERVSCDEIPDIDFSKWISCSELMVDGRPIFKKCRNRNNGHK